MWIRVASFVLVFAACGKPDRKQTCDELARVAVTLADEVGKRLGGTSSASADPEIQQKLAEFRAQCMAWPEEVFECMRKNDETSPKCREAMTHVTGVVATDVAKAPPGPAIVATANLGEAGWDGIPTALASDGTLTAAPDGAIVAVAATGAERWRVELDHRRWFLALPDGAILATDRTKHELVALDPATGAERWRVAIPIAEGGDEYDDRSAEGAVRAGDHTLVVLADGRFLRVDPAACAKRKPHCLALAFALADETFDRPELAAIGDDLVIAESSGIRRFTAGGELVASIHVRDSLGGIAIAANGRLAATIDDELVVFDLARCPRSPVALPRKRGRMYIRGEGECAGCEAPPVGCLVARSELSDVDAIAPAVLRDGSLAVTNFDGPARAAATGAKLWVSEVDAVGPIREVGDHLVFVSRGEDGEPARVVALAAASGKAVWSRPLPEVPSRDISYSSDPIVETAGPWLVAGAKGRVAWMKIR